jgi:hypothetical protein
MLNTIGGAPTMSKAYGVLLANQSTIYISAILLSALMAYAYEARTRTIFACQADGYSSDRYLAYCHGANYADYEHGAFQFDLEPSAQEFARNADVLFLGNSRLQAAFSTVATAEWFSAASARYYLMGFSYFENMIFAEELLRRIHPRAGVYVINVDDFFDRSESLPVKTIFHDPEARNRYKQKHFWQRVHEPICKAFSAFCGTKFVIFRSRETGSYYREGMAQRNITPVSYDESVSQNVVNNNTAAAIDFLSRFVRGKCTILTTVPFVGTKIGNANAIAIGVGAQLVTPGIVDGLQTYDGYHLDQPSAERWSRAFFLAANSRIRSCLEEQGTARPSAHLYQSVAQ